MKISLESTFKNKKSLFFIKTSFLLTILCTFVLLLRIFQILPNFKVKNDLLIRYYALERELASLSSPLNDSIQNSVSVSKYQGVLDGWSDAAKFIEKIRSDAINRGIEFRYTFDSLTTASEIVNNLYRIPINITVYPTNGRFETVLQFFQNTLSDTSLYLSMENMVVTGDDVGLTAANIILYGWMQL